MFGVHLRVGTRSNEELDLGFFGGFARALNEAGQPGGLFGEGESHAAGSDLESGQGTFFGATAIDFRGPGGRRAVLRGKKRATDWSEVVARFWPRRAGCP